MIAHGGSPLATGRKAASKPSLWLQVNPGLVSLRSGGVSFLGHYIPRLHHTEGPLTSAPIRRHRLFTG